MSINQNRNRQREQSIVVADLVDHYIETELSDEADWHSHATRIVYGQFLKRWIRPHWGYVGIRDVRTVAVERWLIYALAAGASSEPGDVSVYAVFRSRLIIPIHPYFLMFAHKIWRGGLKPHPLPCQTSAAQDVEAD
jgi:hypothetical protein